MILKGDFMVKKFFSILLFLCFFHSTSVEAKVIFQCTTQNSKEIHVSEVGANIVYTYGKKNNSEIVINIPIDKTIYHPWPGGSGNMGNVLNIPYKGYVYSIWDLYIRHSNKIEGGVNVFLASKDKDEDSIRIANIKCKEKPKVNHISEDYLSGYPVPEGWK